MALVFGFGAEFETEVAPKRATNEDNWQLYRRFAAVLERNRVPAKAPTTPGQKYPPDGYKKWWITNDSSITRRPPSIGMESVTRVLQFRTGVWDPEVNRFWKSLLAMFTVLKNLSCGTHVHFAPWPSTSRYNMRQLHTLAFAIVYYEPYVVSCLTVERRDNRFCKRNTRSSQALASLYNTNNLVRVANAIKRCSTPLALTNFMQGSDRYVLWNFQNTSKQNGSGTIEFRGGRHMRGPVRSRRWIAFILVFASMAMKENLCYSGRYDPRRRNNDIAANVQRWYEKILAHASTQGVRKYLPPNFKNMSEKVQPRLVEL